ncbi:MAG: alpha/beta hydrolase [Victivallales bacterium]|nr:alpha/beta hydrolase [Victivallales bacterium]
MTDSCEKPKFSYRKIGSGPKKIICIHGFGASCKTFNDIVPFFGNNYEIYLIDLIGFGNSEFIKGWEYTIENQMKLLYAFIKEKKLNGVTLVGHSYGGGIVLLLLNLLREKGEENLVSNAVLIGPACYPQNIPFFIRIPAKHPLLYKLVIFLIPKRILARSMLQKLYINKDLIDKDKINRYAGFFKKSDNINALIRTAQNIVPKNVDEFVEKIKHINIRTLIIWGEKDFIIKKNNILRLNNEIEGSKLKIIKGCAHVVQEEKPETVSSEIKKL